MINEHKYVDEWIKYHIYGLGFSKVFIYDNSDDNNMKSYDGSYDAKVKVTHFPGKVQQLPAYNAFLEYQRGLSAEKKDKWVAYIDCDEFIVLRKHNSIVEFLNEYCKEGAIGLNWFIFGSNAQSEYISEPVVKRFTKREIKVDEHIKSIGVIDDINTVTELHGIGSFKPGKSSRDTSGKILDGPFNPNGPTGTAVIHHYVTKSKGEFIIKRRRGSAATTLTVDINDNFNIHNKNEIEDLSAIPVYERAMMIQKKMKGGRVRRKRKTRRNRRRQ